MAMVVRPIILALLKFQYRIGSLGRAAATYAYEGVFYAYINNVCAHHDLMPVTGYSPVETDFRLETITPGALL